jgi:hypothetical protein
MRTNRAFSFIRERGLGAALFLFIIVVLVLTGCGSGKRLLSSEGYRLPAEIVCPDGGAGFVVRQGSDSIGEQAKDYLIRHLLCELRPPNRTVFIETPTYAEYKRIQQQRGLNNPCEWGAFAGYDGTHPTTIYLFRDRYRTALGQDLGTREKVFRASHEGIGHLIWHYWLFDSEWNQWQTTWQSVDSDLPPREGFANYAADYFMGKRHDNAAGRLLEELLQRIRTDGRQVYRG